METQEEWRPVTAVKGYDVSSFGRVRRSATGTIKGAPISRQGYRVVNLWACNVGRVLTVHRLVAAAFIGPCPSGLAVNHIDGDKLNNLPANLEYLSLADNTRHAVRFGLMPRGERSIHAKLTDAKVREIKRRAKNGERTSDLAAEFNVGRPIISQIKGGTRWRHITE